MFHISERHWSSRRVDNSNNHRKVGCFYLSHQNMMMSWIMWLKPHWEMKIFNVFGGMRRRLWQSSHRHIKCFSCLWDVLTSLGAFTSETITNVTFPCSVIKDDLVKSPMATSSSNKSWTHVYFILNHISAELLLKELRSLCFTQEFNLLPTRTCFSDHRRISGGTDDNSDIFWRVGGVSTIKQKRCDDNMLLFWNLSYCCFTGP